MQHLAPTPRRLPRHLLLAAACTLLLSARTAAPGADAPGETAPLGTAPAAGDVLESDRWYVGDIGGHPAASMHVLCQRHADGGRTESAETKLVVVRSITDAHGPGMNATVLMDEMASSDEDAQGRLLAVRVDSQQGGAHTLASGAVSTMADGSRHLVGELRSLGRRTAIDLALDDTPLLGDHATNVLLGSTPLAVGGSVAYSNVTLLDSLIQVHATATLQSVDQGVRNFVQSCKEVPVQVREAITAAGMVESLHIDLGILTLDLRPVDGPPALLGAVVPSSGLIANAGALPAPAASNRYRLPPGALVVEDEFQRLTDGVVTVVSTAPATPLADAAPFLRGELHLETDDPALAAWAHQQVEGIAGAGARAEAMRQAVRGYLTGDLSVPNGDALETFRGRHGACTEHSALLCAALRVVGIPARIEMGVVWSSDHGGWVGHAWVSAYADGAWRLLDSAFPGQPRSCYLELARGSNGDGSDRAADLIRALTSFNKQPLTTLAR